MTISESYHEEISRLAQPTVELHRALASLAEELEAIDWYNQRIDATGDDLLREILAHNRDEEIEHAVMLFEWLRRRLPHWDEQARAYLFSTGSLVAKERELEAAAAGRPVAPTDLGIRDLAHRRP